MDIKATRHVSTNLEEINDKIARILQDSKVMTIDKDIDLDNLSLPELKEFAEKGGLGACVSKTDVIAETSDDLMYLSGERITVLRHLQDDLYLGYCEGVIGRFNAENVHFVELDPRVLDSLEAEFDIESLEVRTPADLGDHVYDVPEDASDIRSRSRRSLLSHSSISDAFIQSSVDQRHWLERSSMESFITSSTASGTSPSYDNQSLGHRMYRSSFVRTTTPSDTNTFDTSVYNEKYSDEDDSDDDSGLRKRDGQSAQHAVHRSASLASAMPARPPRSHLRQSLRSTTTEDGPGDPSESGISIKKRSTNTLNCTDPMQVDEYGFLLQHSSQQSQRPQVPAKTMKQYRDLEIKWLNLVSKLNAGSVKKDAKLKKLVRCGIPSSVRSRVWIFLAGVNEYRQDDVLSKLQAKPRLPIYDAIEKDIPRCYPDHVLFLDMNDQGQKDLDILLKAYAHYNPQLEYCQGMGRLAGCMLMHMPLEEAFWLFACTIDRYMSGYFTPNLAQLRIDAYIIEQLLRDHEPKLARHLEQNEVMPIMFITQWFLTAFTLTLPWSAVLRVWDVFYFEGVKVFYRVSLAIMNLCKDHLIRECPGHADILDFLLHIPHRFLDVDELLETAFHIKMSKADIAKYAKKATVHSTDTQGLSFEPGLRNLQAGSNHSLSSLKK
ncbi:RabGAP/TBC [Hesseltinella vesiculosa]|uniref:RabGAP/TBC n=1 Tax=Hesseltinella vesiculosa TaxID=101127 RepID=A0A1X2GA61_9FUNG|nr:RabGAP/TBC [Hesseltinella vesiculosa]